MTIFINFKLTVNLLVFLFSRDCVVLHSSCPIQVTLSALTELEEPPQ